MCNQLVYIMEKMLLLIILLINFISIESAYPDEYKAAVVEYYSEHTSKLDAYNNMLEQSNNYINLIKRAAAEGVNIIVFPEAGLTTLKIMSMKEFLSSYSIRVPDKFTIPYKDTSTNPILQNLSYAAKNYAMYVVVNLVETISGDNANSDKYNTDVVFDPSGQIVATYRKINLYNEPGLMKGDHVETFTTNFGVTFGLFTCFDIMFKKPAMEVLQNKNVTDVIFTSAYGSSSPFLHPLALQSGYSTAFGVNLLAANLRDNDEMSTGSGIYSVNDISSVYVSKAKDTELIIQTVKTLKERVVPACSNQRKHSLKDKSNIKSITEYDFAYENLRNYSHVPLPLNGTTVEVCSGELCCKVEAEAETTTTPNIMYQAVAYDGIIFVYHSNITVGKRVCGIIAVDTTLNNSRKVNTLAVTFNKLSLTGTLPKKMDNFTVPITLTSLYIPIESYDYCLHETNEKYSFKMVLAKPTNGINTFAVYNRAYSNDGKPSGVIPTPSTSSALVALPNLFVLIFSIYIKVTLN